MVQMIRPTVAKIPLDTKRMGGEPEVVNSAIVELNIALSLTFAMTSVELSRLDLTGLAFLG